MTNSMPEEFASSRIRTNPEGEERIGEGKDAEATS